MILTYKLELPGISYAEECDEFGEESGYNEPSEDVFEPKTKANGESAPARDMAKSEAWTKAAPRKKPMATGTKAYSPSGP